MFTIRENQLEALKEHQKEHFIERVMGFLREQIPDAAAGLTATEAEQLMATAMNYGLQSEQQVCLYILAHTLLGSGFDQSIPDASRFLQDPSLSGDEKFHRLQALCGGSSNQQG